MSGYWFWQANCLDVRADDLHVDTPTFQCVPNSWTLTLRRRSPSASRSSSRSSSSSPKKEGKKETEMTLPPIPPLPLVPETNEPAVSSIAEVSCSPIHLILKSGQWKHVQSFRSHLDCVRAVAFHPTVDTLFSGSEDSTVKIWTMKSKTATEVEPVFTYRGHTAPVFSVVFNSAESAAANSRLMSQIGHAFSWNGLHSASVDNAFANR